MHIIYIDVPVNVIPWQDRPVEFSNQLALVLTGERWQGDGWRYYYAAHLPMRLLLVMQAGNVTDLQVGRYVKALIGWDDGDNPYVLAGQQGKRHTKISVTMVYDGPLPDGAEVTPLFEIIAKAPRADRPGGWRGGDGGRPRLVADDVTEKHPITLPSRLWVRVRDLGGGNYSAGVRKLAEIAGIAGIIDEE